MWRRFKHFQHCTMEKSSDSPNTFNNLSSVGRESSSILGSSRILTARTKQTKKITFTNNKIKQLDHLGWDEVLWGHYKHLYRHYWLRTHPNRSLITCSFDYISSIIKVSGCKMSGPSLVQTNRKPTFTKMCGCLPFSKTPKAVSGGSHWTL